MFNSWANECEKFSQLKFFDSINKQQMLGFYRILARNKIEQLKNLLKASFTKLSQKLEISLSTTGTSKYFHKLKS